MVLLDRIRVPALAVGEDGGVLFVNSSFADMLGHTVETLRSLTVREIFLNVPSSKDGVVSAIRERDEHIVELMHADGWTVRAKMSKSALLRKDDSVALATFQDLTEKLWVRGKISSGGGGAVTIVRRTGSGSAWRCPLARKGSPPPTSTVDNG